LVLYHSDNQICLDQVLEDLRGSKKRIEDALKRKYGLNGGTQHTHKVVELHRAGDIKEDCWGEAFRKKYKNQGDWGALLAEELSNWEALLLSQQYSPYKVVQVGTDQFKVSLTSTFSVVDLQLASRLTLQNAHVL
jgi:hypothetical protein